MTGPYRAVMARPSGADSLSLTDALPLTAHTALSETYSVLFRYLVKMYIVCTSREKEEEKRIENRVMCFLLLSLTDFLTKLK